MLTFVTWLIPELPQFRFVPFVILCHRLFTSGYEVKTGDYRLLLRREEILQHTSCTLSRMRKLSRTR